MSTEALPFPSGLERMDWRDEVLARPVRRSFCEVCQRSVPTTRGILDGHGLTGDLVISWELCPASGSRPGDLAVSRALTPAVRPARWQGGDEG